MKKKITISVILAAILAWFETWFTPLVLIIDSLSITMNIPQLGLFSVILSLSFAILIIIDRVWGDESK